MPARTMGTDPGLQGEVEERSAPPGPMPGCGLCQPLRQSARTAARARHWPPKSVEPPLEGLRSSLVPLLQPPEVVPADHVVGAGEGAQPAREQHPAGQSGRSESSASRSPGQDAAWTHAPSTSNVGLARACATCSTNASHLPSSASTRLSGGSSSPGLQRRDARVAGQVDAPAVRDDRVVGAAAAAEDAARRCARRRRRSTSSRGRRSRRCRPTTDGPPEMRPPPRCGPAHRSRARVERVHVPVVGADVDRRPACPARSRPRARSRRSRRSTSSRRARRSSRRTSRPCCRCCRRTPARRPPRASSRSCPRRSPNLLPEVPVDQRSRPVRAQIAYMRPL